MGGLAARVQTLHLLSGQDHLSGRQTFGKLRLIARAQDRDRAPSARTRSSATELTRLLSWRTDSLRARIEHYPPSTRERTVREAPPRIG